MTDLMFRHNSRFPESLDSEFEGYTFGFFHFDDCKKLMEMVKNKDIRLSDVGVLFIAMSSVEKSTGKIKFTIKNIAEELNYTSSSVSLALSRLKKACLITPFTERNGDKYYMINPYLFSVGSRQRWGVSIKKFFSAFNE